MSYNQNYFDDINTETKAYFLGLALADATITYKEYRGKMYSRFKMNVGLEDEHIIALLSREIGKPYKIETVNAKSRGKIYQNANIAIQNKHLVNTLIQNFGGALKDERIRFHVPDHLASHFVRGYYDGDGSLSLDQKGYWELGISGREHILQAIATISPVNDLKTYADKSVRRIRIRKHDTISQFLEFIYADVNEDTEAKLDRKYKTYLKFASCKTSGKIGEG